MVFNIVSNHLCSHFVTNCPDKITIFPEFSSPKLFLHLRMLMKYNAGTDALQHSYHLGNRVPWWKAQKDMNMVFCYLKGIYLKIVILGNLLKGLFHSLSNIIPQNPFSVFRSPYQMIFRIVDRMRSSFQFHAVNIAYLNLPSAGKLFIPVYKTGYSSSHFHKLMTYLYGSMARSRA
jgi:hypothetical protein